MTQTRLFVFDLGLSGKARDVQVIVPLQQIEGVEASKGHTMGIKQLNMEIVFDGGNRVVLEVARVNFAAGKGFIDTLEAAIAEHGSKPT